ncbi:MAG TPA: hypothetical protein VMU95_41070 [Trebonia sp.]|nr:hypothetical protein [Trebonia sp.]
MSETTTTATEPTWGTHKDHGHADQLVLLGRDRKSPLAEGKLALISTDRDGLHVKYVVDGIVGGEFWFGGVASRFWARPVTDADRIAAGVSVADTCDECFAPEGEEHEEYCSSTDTEETAMATKPAKTEKPAKTPKPELVPVQCQCGCGQVTGKGSLFRQGHDARMVSNLVALVGKGETSRDEAIKAAAKISEPLKAKTTRALDNAQARADKAAAAKQAKAAAKDAAPAPADAK